MQGSRSAVFAIFLASFIMLFQSGFSQVTKTRALEPATGPTATKAVDQHESLSNYLTTLNLDLPTGKPAVSWNAYVHHFGTVLMGDTVSHEFVVTNTGAGPLRFSGVTSSCGCTVGGYTESDILPGKTGTVTVTFTPKSKGNFEQFLTVISNTEEFVDILTIRGVVE